MSVERCATHPPTYQIRRPCTEQTEKIGSCNRPAERLLRSTVLRGLGNPCKTPTSEEIACRKRREGM